MDMSYDHKPEDEVELTRIKNAGGKVTMDGRVNGGLNLSRAIGAKLSDPTLKLIQLFSNLLLAPTTSELVNADSSH